MPEQVTPEAAQMAAVLQGIENKDQDALIGELLLGQLGNYADLKSIVGQDYYGAYLRFMQQNFAVFGTDILSLGGLTRDDLYSHIEAEAVENGVPEVVIDDTNFHFYPIMGAFNEEWLPIKLEQQEKSLKKDRRTRAYPARDEERYKPPLFLDPQGDW